MPSFILRDLNPEFWRRVNEKAAAEGTTVKELILRLLSTWLGALAILTLVGCAYHAPDAPTVVVPVATAASTAPASIRVTVSTRADRQSDVVATVLSADGHVVPSVPVSFAIDAGTVTPSSMTTTSAGVAQTVASATSAATVTVSTGALSATTRVDAAPAPPAAPLPPATPPPVPLPPASVSITAATGTAGTSMLLQASALLGGVQATSYAWDFGDGGQATTASGQVQHVYLTAGTYQDSVIVTAADGRRASATGSVIINPAPVPTPTPTTPADQFVIALTCSVDLQKLASCNITPTLNGQIVASAAFSDINWDFGDGKTGPHTPPAITHQYTQPGIYTVLVNATSTAASNTARASTTLTVK